MERIKKLKSLEIQWKNERSHYKDFVIDGILDPVEYLKSEPKILFLLKESNSDFFKIAPLSSEHKKGYGPSGSSPLFWRYMRAYESIIRDIWANELFDENKIRIDKEKPNNSTAYLNLKKTCENKSVSNNNDLLKYALHDKEYLKQQINLINPEVIYCGGTFKFYRHLDTNCKYISEHLYESNNRIVIEYLHPAHHEGYKTFKILYDLLNTSEVRKHILKL